MQRPALLLLLAVCWCVGCAASKPSRMDSGPGGRQGVTSSTPDALDAAIGRLVTQIHAKAVDRGRKQIAVAPLVRLTGGVPELGGYLADKLTSRLFEMGGSFTVVDRIHLDSAIRELKLSYTHLVDPDHAKALGRFVGADAIVTGTLTDLDQSFDVTLRLLDTESMNVLATAESRLPHDATMVRMWRTNLNPSDVPTTATEFTVPVSSVTAPSSVPSPVRGFQDDFERDDLGPWRPESGDWVIQRDTEPSGRPGRVLRLRSEGGVFFAFVGEPTWDDYVIEFDARGTGGLRIPFRVQDGANLYYWYLYGHASQMQMIKRGKDTQVSGWANKNTALREWRHIRITVQGGTTTCQVDGIQHHRFEDATFPNGRVGVGADGPTSFDNFRVTPLR
jgi:hypothetical protein